MMANQGSRAAARRTTIAGLITGLLLAAMPAAMSSTGCGDAQIWQQVGSIPLGSPFERLHGPVGDRLFVNRSGIPLSTDVFTLDGSPVGSVEGAVNTASALYAYSVRGTVVDVVTSNGTVVQTLPGNSVSLAPDGTIYVISGSHLDDPVVTRFSGDGGTALSSLRDITAIVSVGGSYLLARLGEQYVAVNADLSAYRPLLFGPDFDDREVIPQRAGLGANDGYGFVFSQRLTPFGTGVLVDDTRMDVFDLASGQLVTEILQGPDEWFPSIEFDAQGRGYAVDQTSGTLYAITGGTSVTPLAGLPVAEPSSAPDMTVGNGFIYAGLVGPHITVHDQQGGLVGRLDQSDDFVTLAASDGVVVVHDADRDKLDIYSATGDMYRTFDVSRSDSGSPERLRVANGHVYLTTDVEVMILSCDTGFVDVGPSDYFHDAVLRLANARVTSGVGDGRYAPYATVTRAEMAAFISRSIGNPNPPVPVTPPFPDVPVDTWYAGYVEHLVQAGITTGKGDGTYGPSDPVIRGDMALFLVRSFLD